MEETLFYHLDLAVVVAAVVAVAELVVIERYAAVGVKD
jgi:hypothetical protein